MRNNEPSLEFTMAWITRDENTESNVTNIFTLTLTGAIDHCREGVPQFQQPRNEGPIEIDMGGSRTVDAMPVVAGCDSSARLVMVVPPPTSGVDPGYMYDYEFWGQDWPFVSDFSGMLGKGDSGVTYVTF
jgi:hypothetical protein